HGKRRVEAGRPAHLTPPAAPAGWREVLMKFHARLHRGSKTLEQDLELVAHETPNGVRRFRIGNQNAEAHCEEITLGVYSLLMNGRPYEAYVSKRPGDAPGLASPFVVVVGLRRYL